MQALYIIKDMSDSTKDFIATTLISILRQRTGQTEKIKPFSRMRVGNLKSQISELQLLSSRDFEECICRCGVAVPRKLVDVDAILA